MSNVVHTSVSTSRRLHGGCSIAAMIIAASLAAVPHQAHAQVAPNLVGGCSGVSLPPSVVTGILGPVITDVVAPLQGAINPLLGLLSLGIGTPPVPLSIDVAGILRDAAAGRSIGLQTVNADGVLVGPTDRCDLQADSFQLRQSAGIAIGGNRITGLGTAGSAASAGETTSIAFGDAAATDGTAIGALAFGARSTVGASAARSVAIGADARASAAGSVALGAGSIAERGALGVYAAPGLAALQTSAGEISIGAPGAERQLTNVAAGTQGTDAVNLTQLAGVAGQVGALAGTAVLYDSTTRDRVTLGGAGGTVIANLAPGTVAAGSTEAVNGGQLAATDRTVAGNSSSIVNLTTQLVDLDDSVVNGAIGPVRYSNPGSPGVPNGGVRTNDVVLVGAAPGPVGLHGVADGVLTAGSTDAVNGGQISALGGSAAAALGGTSRYDPAANTVSAGLTYGGASYDSVQAAFDAVSGTVIAGPSSPYFRVRSALAGATVSADDGVAIGPQASVTAANGVALGAGSVAARGALDGYAATGLTSPQVSAGEVAVGSGGIGRQITGVAAGSAPGDAVNVAQLEGVAARIDEVADGSVRYDDASRSAITLAGAQGTRISNVSDGRVATGSTDAVNGGQLAATNDAVAGVTASVTNLSVAVSNGSTGPVRYSDPAAPTTPNGGIRTDDLTLVGATGGPVVLHNVAAGSIADGSTDAVNGGQVAALGRGLANAVTYDTDAAGTRTGGVTLASRPDGGATTLGNVAAGEVAAGSRQAVNGGQLFATNAAIITAQSTADAGLALGANSIQYDQGRAAVTFAGAGGAVALRNVAPGTAGTDAVNLNQLGAGLGAAVSQANAYTDGRILALDYDIRSVRREARAGTAAAMAAAGLPQAYGPGRGMIAMGGGTYRGASAVAIGFSKAFDDGHTVVKIGGTYDSRGNGGASGGVGYQF